MEPTQPAATSAPHPAAGQLPEGVEIVTREDGTEFVRIATALCSGEIHRHGAHVTSWQPAGGEEVLWLSPLSAYEVGGPAIRGGIPVCAPWFGPGRTGDKKPAHGFARTSVWELVDVAERDGAIYVTMRLSAADAATPTLDCPKDALFELTAGFGTSLDVALTVRAGDEPVDLEEALHTYLAVSDVRQVEIVGLDGARYVDKVDPSGEGGEKVQSEPIRFTGETDRVYRRGGPVTLVDAGQGRRIQVVPTGAADTVVWNPGDVKGPAAKDIGENWPHFACVESANCLDSALTVAPGTSATMSTRISVAGLDGVAGGVR